ncbi:MAG TPA: hypothetical protein VHK67_02695 [Rhabdochlamydiaceae bacterium]|nr:hypothetical protein [Rhabdochlamydiaceae bacterium]
MATTALTPPTATTSAPGSQGLSQQVSDIGASTSSVATTRFSLSSSSTPIRLSGDKTPDEMEERLEQALQYIDSQQGELAIPIFLELIGLLENDDSRLIMYAHCLIELAFACPKNSNEQKDYVKQAKNILDAALSENLSKQTVIEDLLSIKFLYTDLQALIPEDQTELHQAVAAKIEECVSRIPVIDNFYSVLSEAESHLEQNNIEEARKIVREALNTLTQRSPIFYLAIADGLIFIAKISEGEQRNQALLYAKDWALNAYSGAQILLQAIPSNDSMSETFSQLSPLFPNDAELNTILNNFNRSITDSSPQLSEDEFEIEEENPVVHPTKSMTLKKEKKQEVKKDILVSEKPVGDFWKPLKIFVAFSVAIAAFIGIGYMGQRSITKWN